MKRNLFITLTSTLFFLMNACEQKIAKTSKADRENPAQNIDTTYTIGDYEFDPSKKIVAIHQTFGAADGVGTASGYIPDQRITYDSTALIVLGNQIVFKEYFPKGVDFKTLQYIGELGHGEGLFKDKHYIYEYASNHLTKGDANKIDISAYTCINDYVYGNEDGTLYFLSNKFELEKITGLPDIDKHTLKHLQGQYFTDKNGLYAFGIHYLSAEPNDNSYSEQAKYIVVERSNGKKITPIVTRNYLIYNKSVYAKNYSIEKLKLDVDKMIEVKWGDYENIYFITDGTNLYENRNSNYYERNWNKDNQYANDFFKSDINILKIYSPQLKFLQGSDKTTLYFNNIKQGKTRYTEKDGILIKTTRGYFFANTGQPDLKPQKIENILIYNEATKKNEAFDEQQFLSIQERIYAYRGLIFCYHIPVEGINGIHNLRFFTYKGVKTNFVTDGKTLIAFGNIGGYQSENRNGEEKIIFKKRIQIDVDVAKLKAIHKNLLVDENNFYDCSNGSLQVIPFKKLGLEVKLLLAKDLSNMIINNKR